MGQVKAPDVPQPKRGLTDFERKIADILFAETSTNELQVKRVLDLAIAIGEGLMKEAVGCMIAKESPDFRGEGHTIWIKVNTDVWHIEDRVKLIIIKED